MKRNAKTFAGTSRVLTDPEPEFVSLVKAGANMTPFLAVKLDPTHGEAPMTVRVRTRSAAAKLGQSLDLNPVATPAPEAAPAPEVVPVVDFTAETPVEETAAKAEKVQKQEGFEIAKFVFVKGDVFADEAAVKAWLDDGAYSDYDLAVEGETFVVTSKSAFEFDGDLAEVEVVAGALTSFVGKLKVAEEVTKEVDVASSTAEVVAVEEVNPVAKSDEAPAETAEKTEESKDVVAPEAPAAVETGVAPAEKAEKSVYTVSCLAEVAVALTYLANDATWEAEYEGDATKSASVAKLKSLAAEALSTLSVVAAEEAAEAAQKTEEPAPAEAPVVTEKTETVEEAAPAVDQTALITEVVKAAVGPLAEMIAALTESVKSTAEAVTTVKAEISERVEALETSSQTRKSADAEEAGRSSPEATKKDDASDFVRGLATRGALGISLRR